MVRLQALGLSTLAMLHGASAATSPPDSLHVPADPGPGGGALVRPFRLDQVRLGDGLLQQKRDLMKEFLRAYDARRFLVLFNNQAARPNPEDVEVPGGWEDGGLLSGHWAGHFMTALSQAYADQREEEFKEKLDWMVAELAECQKAITNRMGDDDGPGSGGDPETPTVGRVDGRFGKALQLNRTGAARYVTFPQEAVNQLSDFTIATWVNLDEDDQETSLFTFGHDTSRYMAFTPRVASNGNAPRFAISTSGEDNAERIDGGVELPTGEWVHVAVTLAQGVGTVYVDGEAVGTNEDMTVGPADLDSPSRRWIGRSLFNNSTLNAKVDEFHIFDRALEASDIHSLQDTASGNTNGSNVAWYRFDEDGGTTAEDSSPGGRDAGIVGSGDGEDGDGAWIPTHPGYLGALPEDTVLRLGPPRWAVYGSDANSNTWAPWYTQHKIMRGLLDAYYNTNNSQALEVVTEMAEWAHLALTLGDMNHPEYKGNLTRDDLNYMWDLYIAGEFGGANEVFPEIYALTGDERHLETAKFFDNRASLFGAAVDDHDVLVVTPEDNPGPRRAVRLHANTHVPQFVGYMSVYERSGEQEYLDAAKNFYGWVVPHREFASGGTGGNYPGAAKNSELFQNRGNIANAIAEAGAETCTSYNMLKLARRLFLHEHNATYMDHYERGLFNMIAGSRADQASSTDPLLTYFQPLTPGSQRDYGNTGTCCGGTGMESHTKYQETVYFKSADGSALWVNLFVPSTLDWTEKDFQVVQETDFPRSEVTTLRVNGDGALDIKIRVPGWATSEFGITVNGEAAVTEEDDIRPSTYVSIRRTWQRGDHIEVHMPFRIRIERALDRPDTQAIMWGPILLQTLGTPRGGPGNSSFWEFSLYKHLKLDGDYSTKAIQQTDKTGKGDPVFTIAEHDQTARPYYISDTQTVSSYFRRVEPTVIFGGVNTGVPNRKRNDGLPHYDVPVAGIPSPGTDGPTFLDLLWDQAPFGTHNEFVRAATELAGRFVGAHVYSDEERKAIIEGAQEAEDDLAP